MEFSEIVWLNLKEDFERLLPLSPARYLTCNITVGYGGCRRGILSKDDKAESVFLSKPKDFEFGLAKRLISEFSRLKSKKPLFSSLMLFVGLVVPFKTSHFIHRLYKIKEKDDKTFLKRQSYLEGDRLKYF